MPSSFDMPLNGAGEAQEPPMAFRRQPNWFLSFLMMPFQDVDERAVEPAGRPAPGSRHSR